MINRAHWCVCTSCQPNRNIHQSLLQGYCVYKAKNAAWLTCPLDVGHECSWLTGNWIICNRITVYTNYHTFSHLKFISKPLSVQYFFLDIEMSIIYLKNTAKCCDEAGEALHEPATSGLGPMSNDTNLCSRNINGHFPHSWSCYLGHLKRLFPSKARMTSATVSIAFT